MGGSSRIPHRAGLLSAITFDYCAPNMLSEVSYADFLVLR